MNPSFDESIARLNRASRNMRIAGYLMYLAGLIYVVKIILIIKDWK